jgi:precorrin-2 dehydrogenase/sirohydrochlorin ferrochelatase
VIPIVLVPDSAKIGLAGAGDALARRKDWLVQTGVEPVRVSEGSEITGLRLLFVAGMPLAEAERLAGRARAAGILVNVEDVPELCDFHVPATVRRGDLLLSISTGGKAPGLARMIREWLEARFGPQWSYRLDHLGQRRLQWRGEGQSASEVSRRTREFVEQRHWL